MSATESELVEYIYILINYKYSLVRNIGKDIPKHHDLVKYGMFLMSLMKKLHGTPDRANNTPNQYQLIFLIDNCFTYRSLPQVNLGSDIIDLFKETNDLLEFYFNYFNNIDLSLMSLSEIRTINPQAYDFLPVGVNINKIKFLDILFNNVLIDLFKKENIDTLRKDNARFIQEIKREMHFILNTCARDNHRKLDPRFIGAIGSINSFMRTMSITLFYYEQRNPKVPIVLILYIFAVLVWGDGVSKIISSIPVSKKYSANSFFSTATIGSLVFSVLVALQKEKLGLRIAIEFGSYFSLPWIHLLLLQIPPVYKLINKIFPEENYYYPRRYPGKNIRRNLSNSARVYAAYTLPNFLIATAWVVHYCGYDIHNNFPVFFAMNVTIFFITQTIYFLKYYFAIPRYATDAEKNELLPKVKLGSLISIERNQSLKDLQSEIIWMIVFNNFFLRFFIKLNLAISDSNSLGKMLVGIFGCVFTVLLSPYIGTFLQRELLARQSPASVSRDYLEFRKDNGYNISPGVINRVSELLKKSKKYPQNLSQRVQQVTLAAQTGKMSLGFGDYNILQSIVMLQFISIKNYYILDIALFNIVNNTSYEHGTIKYSFLEAIVNLVLIFTIMISLIFLLKQARLPLVLLEAYGLPTRIGRAVKRLYLTGNLKESFNAFKQHTFVKDYPGYYGDLSTRMRSIIEGRETRQTGQTGQISREIISRPAQQIALVSPVQIDPTDRQLGYTPVIREYMFV